MGKPQSGERGRRWFLAVLSRTWGCNLITGFVCSVGHCEGAMSSLASSGVWSPLVRGCSTGRCQDRALPSAPGARRCLLGTVASGRLSGCACWRCI